MKQADHQKYVIGNSKKPIGRLDPKQLKQSQMTDPLTTAKDYSEVSSVFSKTLNTLNKGVTDIQQRSFIEIMDKVYKEPTIAKSNVEESENAGKCLRVINKLETRQRKRQML